MIDQKERILVICVHNSARSQMGEEYIRKYGDDLFDVESAGLEPGTLNPFVVAVLKEEGIDISGKKTRSAFDLYNSGKTYDYVITVCSKEAEERCPLYPGVKERLHWPFSDPSSLDGTNEEKLNRTREIRDEIKETVKQFVDNYRRLNKVQLHHR